jgi:methylmalonyl-CoA mutase N-terminal domain/subunit
VDPCAGSYAIEAMTSRIEADATVLLDRIDALGGTLAAIDAGYIQRQIQDAAYRAQQAVDEGTAVVVGVNQYTEAAGAAAPVFRLDAASERRQMDRVRAMRAGRRDDAWRAAVAAVDRAARGGENLVPVIINAVEAHATVGEIADTLRGAFGEFHDASAE